VTSRAQVDKLGERLKAGPTTEADLRLLDEYRLTFDEAYQHTIGGLVALQLRPTGRPAKSTKAIVDKLRRESIRLTQVQDIAGCRVVVETMADQDVAAARVSALFSECQVLDRRAFPSHGYRAVHVIAMHGDRLVEIQIRTAKQHDWAELSEKLTDLVDPAIKYGGGPLIVGHALQRYADAIYGYDRVKWDDADSVEPDPPSKSDLLRLRIELSERRLPALNELSMALASIIQMLESLSKDADCE
jgi:putative GTP pyrophosphokinase